MVASGVVYRLQETAVVIAVDEAPDDGLDQPLRLEKLANDVSLLSEADVYACHCGAVLSWVTRVVDKVKQVRSQIWGPSSIMQSSGFVYVGDIPALASRAQSSGWRQQRGPAAARHSAGRGGLLGPAASLPAVASSMEAAQHRCGGHCASCDTDVHSVLARDRMWQRQSLHLHQAWSACGQPNAMPSPGLDDSQKAAVSLALAAQDVALIHGPPGTGVHGLSHRQPGWCAECRAMTAARHRDAKPPVQQQASLRRQDHGAGGGSAAGSQARQPRACLRSLQCCGKSRLLPRLQLVKRAASPTSRHCHSRAQWRHPCAALCAQAVINDITPAQVDNMVERLARQAPKTKILRLGHPARLLPEVERTHAAGLSACHSMLCMHVKIFVSWDVSSSCSRSEVPSVDTGRTGKFEDMCRSCLAAWIDAGTCQQSGSCCPEVRQQLSGQGLPQGDQGPQLEAGQAGTQGAARCSRQTQCRVFARTWWQPVD